MNNKNIIKFKDDEFEIDVNVGYEDDTVWLTQDQIVSLFETSKSNVSEHIKNIFKENELEEDSVVRKFRTTANDGKKYNKKHYNLDVIISVGYRVKSKRGVLFRKWATKVLKDYMVQGYAINQNVLNVPLPDYHKLIKNLNSYRNMNGELDVTSTSMLDFLVAYDKALQMLDKYDHQETYTADGTKDTYVISYEECKRVIEDSCFTGKNDLFGTERDDSFKGSINAIYQSFFGDDLYPTLELKSANLLYYITKNHSFIDGNKRIASIIFLYFLNQNNALYINGEERINGDTLATLTILVASSKPEDKESIINLILMILN